MFEREVCISDTFRVGTAVVQITQPRVPCFKLGIKMGDPQFIKRFHRSGRSGFYLRVIEEGEIGARWPIRRYRGDAGRSWRRFLCGTGRIEYGPRRSPALPRNLA